MTAPPEVHVLAGPAEVAAAAARILVEAVRASGHVALSGGSTPAAAYAGAADALDDWRGGTLWFGDERAVPPDDPLSNYRMAELSLLERLAPERRPAVQRIGGEHGAEAAAAEYEVRLREHLGDRPRLDLALMGIGPDAHTASLFPARPEVDERKRLVVAVPEAGMDPRVPRVSMTLPVFNAAALVVFLIAGQDKAQAVRRAFGKEADAAAPAAHVRPQDGRLLVLCDEAAAAEL